MPRVFYAANGAPAVAGTAAGGSRMGIAMIVTGWRALGNTLISATALVMVALLGGGCEETQYLCAPAQKSVTFTLGECGPGCNNTTIYFEWNEKVGNTWWEWPVEPWKVNPPYGFQVIPNRPWEFCRTVYFNQPGEYRLRFMCPPASNDFVVCQYVTAIGMDVTPSAATVCADCGCAVRFSLANNCTPHGVTWSVSPANGVTLTPDGESATVTPNGTATGVYTITATSVDNTNCLKTATLTVVKVDLDIDSDNDDGFGFPDCGSSEDLWEDSSGDPAHPGKVILINDGDADRDGLPDYVDGYDLDPLCQQDDACPGLEFVPIVLQVSGLSPSARITIDYDANAPTNVVYNSSTDGSGDFYIFPEGKLRLWTKEGGTHRNLAAVKEGGDFLAPGIYSVSQLGFSSSTELRTNFYVEAVACSSSPGDIPIRVLFDVYGDSSLVLTDQVRVTVTRIAIQGYDHPAASSSNCNEVATLFASGMHLEMNDASILVEGTNILYAAGIGAASDGRVTNIAPGVYDMQAAAAGLLDTNDGCYMAYFLQETGNLDFSAGVASFTATGAVSRVGIGMRSQYDDDASYVFVGLDSDGDYLCSYRTTQGLASVQVTGPPASVPGARVRLVSSGGTITAYCSTNAVDWIPIATNLPVALGDLNLLGMVVASGDTGVTASATFTNCLTPLCDSMTLTFIPGTTPSSYQTYRLRIDDPRLSALTSASAAGTSIPLTTVGSYLLSDEFICIRPGESLDLQPCPAIVISATSSNIPVQYNPMSNRQFDDELARLPEDDRIVAKTVDDVVKGMMEEKWEGTGKDAGEFGKEADRRTAARLAKKQGFAVDVYVETDTGRVVGVGAKKGFNIDGTTQVDSMSLEKGYTPEVGKVLDKSKVKNIYEHKCSLTGYVDPDQKARLKVVGGRDFKVVRSRYRWTSASKWHENLRVSTAMRVFTFAACVSSLHSMVMASEYDDELDAIHKDIIALKAKMGAGNPDVQLQIEMLSVAERLCNYLGHFDPSGNVNGIVKVPIMYRILGMKWDVNGATLDP